MHKYPGGAKSARTFSFQNPGHSGHTVFSNKKTCCLSSHNSGPARVNLISVHFEHTQSATANFATQIPLKKFKRRAEEKEVEEDEGEEGEEEEETKCRIQNA